MPDVVTRLRLTLVDFWVQQMARLCYHQIPLGSRS